MVLIILDGWGVAPAGEGNALSQAKPPFFNELITKYPCLTLNASGSAVGLPAGAVGGSEVGHMVLGAGRACPSGREQIKESIADGSFFKLPIWLQTFKQLKKYDSSLHLVGLLGDGQGQADFNHLLALLELAKRKKLTKVYIHCILDGRETPRANGLQYINRLEQALADSGVGQIASLSGRFYALDRDRHWDRTEAAYKLLTEGAGERSGQAAKAVKKSYEQKIYDEQFKPTVIVDKTNQPKGLIKDNDAVIFFNWLPDGIRQLARALAEPEFTGFKRTKPGNLQIITLSEYENGLPVKTVLAKKELKGTLGEVLAKAGLKQLRIAETEKYAHATYFFNGAREGAFSGEEHLLIPSPLTANYSATPAMAASAIVDAAEEKINQAKYDFILINLANADMVGHTGDLAATIKAAQAVDEALSRLLKKIIEVGGLALLTADHGNAEMMMDWQLGRVAKEHTANPVPFIIVGSKFEGYNLGMADAAVSDLSLLGPSGSLADVAPTILKLLGIEQPENMTGKSLL